MVKQIEATVTQKINMNTSEMMAAMEQYKDMPFADFLKMLEEQGKTSLHSVSIGEAAN